MAAREPTAPGEPRPDVARGPDSQVRDTQARERPVDDARAIPDLLRDITSDFGTLMGDEVTLAKKEIQNTIRTAVKDGVYVIAGGVVAYIGTLVLIAAAVLALAEILDPWLSALIIGGVVTLFGVIMLLRGVSEMTSLSPTERTTRNVKADAKTVKEHAPTQSRG